MGSPEPRSPLETPLLNPFAAAARQQTTVRDEQTIWASARRLCKDFSQQLGLAGPLAVNLVAANAAAVINLYFVARGGTAQLAAAALGNNVAVMLGRLVLLGLCGALDTLAAQAWGAGKESRLPVLLQRTVLFLWAHCIVVSAAMMALPSGLAAMGQDPNLARMVRNYLVALLPSVWLEAISRPITRVLVARGTAAPQMVIALIGLPLNVATNYGLVVAAGWEYLGAAAAMSAAAGYDVLLLLLYVALSGQWNGVLGVPSRRALRGWRHLAKLAYPAASMKCAESWAFTIMTLAASLLPSPYIATAAVGVAYNVYGVVFITFVACSTAACVTVGNKLGAGDARGAKLAAAGSLLVVPLAWGVAAVGLLVPHCQDVIMALFVTPSDASSADGDGGGGSAALFQPFAVSGARMMSPSPRQSPTPSLWVLAGTVATWAAKSVTLGPLGVEADGHDPTGSGAADDEVLGVVLRHMFVIVAWLVLLDGIQTILSGVIQGCGRQDAGALVNLVAFYVFAVPLGLFLGFRLSLPRWMAHLPSLKGGQLGLGLGPEGLYLGMAAGPLIQTVCYSYILWRTNWERASERAVTAALMQSTSSIASILRRMDPGALGGAPLSRVASITRSGTVGGAWLLPIIEELSAEGTSSDGSSVRLWLMQDANLGEDGDGSGSGGQESDAGEGEVQHAGDRSAAAEDLCDMATRVGGVGKQIDASAAAVCCAVKPATRAEAVFPVPPADGFAAAPEISPSFLSLSHGSLPGPDDTPGDHCPLAATLDLGSPATASAVASAFASGSRDSLFLHSPQARPTGMQHAPQQLHPHHARALQQSKQLHQQQQAPPQVIQQRSGLMPCTLPAAVQRSAPVSVPTGLAPVMGAGGGNAPAAAVSTAVQPPVQPARWFRFGWSRAPAPVRNSTDSSRGTAGLPAGGSALPLNAEGLPLQLPGVVAPDTVTIPDPAAPVLLPSGYDGPNAGGQFAGVGLVGGKFQVRDNERVALAASTPEVAAATVAAGPRPIAAATPRQRCTAADVCGIVTGSPESASSTISATSVENVDNDGCGAVGGGSGNGSGKPGGEVYRSCQSLAAAIPGSGDFYVFSAGGSAGSVNGVAWLGTPSDTPCTAASFLRSEVAAGDTSAGRNGSIHENSRGLGSDFRQHGLANASLGAGATAAVTEGGLGAPVGGFASCVEGGAESDAEYYDARTRLSASTSSSLSPAPSLPVTLPAPADICSQLSRGGSREALGSGDISSGRSS